MEDALTMSIFLLIGAITMIAGAIESFTHRIKNGGHHHAHAHGHNHGHNHNSCAIMLHLSAIPSNKNGRCFS